MPGELACQRPCVGVDEQLVRVAAQSLVRVVDTMNPITVLLAGTAARQVPVPDLACVPGQVIIRDRVAARVEQAQLDPLSDR